MRNKMGRPRVGQEADIEWKVFAARLLLVERMTVAEVRRVAGCGSNETLYAWVREACRSDHELADALALLAERRGLLPPQLEVAG